jgi:glycosyltransferase involved in cell wall biosynthesis
LTVYNPVDRYYAFQFVNGEKIRDYERQVARRADVVICTSDAIKKDLSPYNKNCFTVRHGVHFDHFHSAHGIENVPEDIRDIPKPIIGYFGGLYERVNYKLIYDVAIRYPHANIVLVGSRMSNLKKIEKLANVHFLGFKNFAELPLYLKEFTVCLIPYHVNELMEGVDPVKLREYLCLGKPVVSVDLPEVRRFKDLVYIGKSEEDFVKKVGVAMLEDNSVLVGKRISVAKSSGWSYRMQEIRKIIGEVLERKNQGRNDYWTSNS